jgi:hypothetical protein
MIGRRRLQTRRACNLRNVRAIFERFLQSSRASCSPSNLRARRRCVALTTRRDPANRPRRMNGFDRASAHVRRPPRRPRQDVQAERGAGSRAVSRKAMWHETSCPAAIWCHFFHRPESARTSRKSQLGHGLRLRSARLAPRGTNPKNCHLFGWQLRQTVG